MTAGAEGQCSSTESVRRGAVGCSCTPRNRFWKCKTVCVRVECARENIRLSRTRAQRTQTHFRIDFEPYNKRARTHTNDKHSRPCPLQNALMYHHTYYTYKYNTVSSPLRFRIKQQLAGSGIWRCGRAAVLHGNNISGGHVHRRRCGNRVGKWLSLPMALRMRQIRAPSEHHPRYTHSHMGFFIFGCVCVCIYLERRPG